MNSKLHALDFSGLPVEVISDKDMEILENGILTSAYAKHVIEECLFHKDDAHDSDADDLWFIHVKGLSDTELTTLMGTDSMTVSNFRDVIEHVRKSDSKLTITPDTLNIWQSRLERS